MENHPFIDYVPIKSDDFPWRTVTPSRVSHFFDATEGWKRERPFSPGARNTEAHSAQQPRQEQLRGLRCEDLLSTLLPRLLKRGDLLVIEMGLRDF